MRHGCRQERTNEGCRVELTKVRRRARHAARLGLQRKPRLYGGAPSYQAQIFTAVTIRYLALLLASRFVVVVTVWSFVTALFLAAGAGTRRRCFYASGHHQSRRATTPAIRHVVLRQGEVCRLVVMGVARPTLLLCHVLR